jgi:hypothetical protein
MRFWLDTEFIDDGRTIDLLSIALVSQTGREYYAVSRDADWSKASEWVQKNVLPYLDRVEAKPRAQIRHEIERFIFGVLELESPGAHRMPEIWAWYGSYDWVAFSQLWGRMIDLPDWLPHYVRDVKQLADDLMNPRLPSRQKGEHHALEDAKWTRKCWEILEEIRKNLMRGEK